MKKSKQAAIGGILSAISLISLFCSGIFPFAEYTFPALAGMLLIPLVIEINKRTALLAYAVVSLLSIFMVSNKEAAMLFLFFFGYYPIVKNIIERINKPFFEWIIKLLIFNLSVVSAYVIIINVMGMTELADELSMGMKWGAAILLGLGNVAFVVYDLALTRIIYFYVKKIRPRFKLSR